MENNRPPAVPPVSCGLLFAAALLTGAAADSPVLSQAEMQRILQSLRTDFARPEAADYTALNRAAINGLLRDHPHAVQVLTLPERPPVPQPPLTASLTPHIACIRPFAFGRTDVESVREALIKFAAGETAALILDLRAPGADGDPAAAAEFAGLFLPKDSPVFTFRAPVKTATDPVWMRELLVLTDQDTGNTGEILAAVLRRQQRALLAGSATRGRTAAIAEVPLRTTGSSRVVLRYTAQRVNFGEGPDPFGQGLMPDLPMAQTPEIKGAVFAMQAKEGFARSVFQPARPRVSEASLVARTNPELPERIARTAGRPSRYEGALTDRPLQLAVDVLIARRSLEPADRK